MAFLNKSDMDISLLNISILALTNRPFIFFKKYNGCKKFIEWKDPYDLEYGFNDN